MQSFHSFATLRISLSIFMLLRVLLSPSFVYLNVSACSRILNLTNFLLPDLISCWGCSWGR